MTPLARTQSPLTGLLLVDKPAGPTSMDVVRVVRNRAGGARTGHAGTLDPLATGLLILCIGRPALRLIPRLMDLPKRYSTVIDLSAFSSTDDAEGELAVPASINPPTNQQIASTIASRFTGVVMQSPPPYSAVKVGGVRAYKLARRGEPPTLAPRPITIHSIDIINYDFPRLTLDIHCGKGTYIRSIARDLGTALGTGGHLTSLRRTSIGDFSVDRATPLDLVPNPLTNDLLLDPVAHIDSR